MFFILLIISLSIRENTAQIKYYNISVENYTSCEQFLANTTFNPQSVVDIDWKIFYFWNYNYEESYNVKFSLASKVLVDRYRVELDGEMSPPVNWSNAELFMESTVDFSALFVKTNVSGMFIIIPSLAFEYSKIPQMTFAMKVVKPGYLGILNCKHRLCYALAPENLMPDQDALEEAAKKIGFWSDFGRAYTTVYPPPPSIPPDHVNMDDDDEDEHLELIHNDNMQFF